MLNEILYLVVECSELGDQWECDADRTPIFITNNEKKAFDKGEELCNLYEVYKCFQNGEIKRIKYYEDENPFPVKKKKRRKNY